MTILDDGRPIFVEGDEERIGKGPWARWLATAVVPDEGSARAERGRVLARTGHVHSVTIAKGEITGRVIGSNGGEYSVGLAADPVPPRVWAAIVRSPSAKAQFAPATAGREQSLQLEHVMTVDWEEPLVPPMRSIRRSCTCPDVDRTGACKHVIALGYVVAAAIDAEPGVLLEWRGCVTEAPQMPDAAPERTAPEPGAWTAGRLPQFGPARPLPIGSVLKRLGPSGLVVDGIDLRDALEPAYAAFAAAT